jgi:hypothetical protein
MQAVGGWRLAAGEMHKQCVSLLLAQANAASIVNARLYYRR